MAKRAFRVKFSLPLPAGEEIRKGDLLVLEVSEDGEKFFVPFDYRRPSEVVGVALNGAHPGEMVRATITCARVNRGG